MVSLISFKWARKKHQHVETYRHLGVCLRSFSLHFDYNWDVDGYSIGLGWLQVSWGMFSLPLKQQKEPHY